jgi:hypothetical protein
MILGKLESGSRLATGVVLIDHSSFQRKSIIKESDGVKTGFQIFLCFYSFKTRF